MTRIRFRDFSYNEHLLHRAAIHYLKTGVKLSYEDAISLDVDWDNQLTEMARLIQRETSDK